MSDLPPSGETAATPKPAENAPTEAISNAPEYKEPYAKRCKRHCNRKLRQAPVWIQASCSVALVGITFFYTYFAARQWHEMKRAADATKQAADATAIAAQAAQGSAGTAKDALEKGQRAFVLGLYDTRTDDKGQTILVRWENDGLTATKNMTMHVSFSGFRSTELPRGFGFPDIWVEGQAHVPTRVAIASKGSIPAAQVFIPGHLIGDIVKAGRPLHYYVWGWARYRDQFTGTPEHITKFCADFSSVTTKPNEIFVYPLVMNVCAEHVCHDEECTK
jgi:hypothetical protein